MAVRPCREELEQCVVPEIVVLHRGHLGKKRVSLVRVQVGITAVLGLPADIPFKEDAHHGRVFVGVPDALEGNLDLNIISRGR